jgi:hypothetical protein
LASWGTRTETDLISYWTAWFHRQRVAERHDLMTVFEKYRKRARQKYLESVPQATLHQVRMLLTEADSLEGMPDAELTPELVDLRRAEMEFARSGFEILVMKGRIFIELRKRVATEEKFWQHVTAKMKTTREDAELAIEAAQDAN